MSSVLPLDDADTPFSAAVSSGMVRQERHRSRVCSQLTHGGLEEPSGADKGIHCRPFRPFGRQAVLLGPPSEQPRELSRLG